MPKPRMPQTPAEFQAWADLYPPQPGSKTGPIDKKELYNREVDFFDWEQEQGDAMIAGLERRGIAAKPGDPDYEAANEAFLARVDAEHARRFNPAERKALEEMSRERSWGLIGDGSEDTADWMETLPDGAMTMHPGTKSQRINAMNEDAAAAAAKAAKAPAPVPTPAKKPTAPQAILRQKVATTKLAGPEPANKPKPAEYVEADSWELPVGLPEEAGIRTVATPEELRRKAASSRTSQ